MFARYHRLITRDALEKHVSQRALESIIDANIHQDDWRFLLGGYPHHHFDDSEFERTYAYLDEQRRILLAALAIQDHPQPAWQAFGRIAHALQDFYSHSNYLQLWVEKISGDGSLPDLARVDPLVPEILSSPRLMTARTDLFREILAMIPLLGDRLRPRFPPDIHASMNLDAPTRGPMFAYAFAAASMRTRAEFETLAEQISGQLGKAALEKFVDRNS